MNANKDLSLYSEVFYDSDIKQTPTKLHTQKFTEGLQSSQASNGTITGPGSSFLINETYEQQKEIPQFHECTRNYPVERRNRAISTHCKEEKRDLDHGRTLRLALEKLLAGFRRAKDAVFQAISTHSPEEIVVLLRSKGAEGFELLGVYTRAGERLVRIYPSQSLPQVIELAEVSALYRLDPISATYRRIPSGQADAVSL